MATKTILIHSDLVPTMTGLRHALPSSPPIRPCPWIQPHPTRIVSVPKPISWARQRSMAKVLKSAPTRKHWLKDETVLECGIPLCGKQFNFFERRHHCRKCGGIYCKEHTSHYLYINHLAQFTTGGRGTLSKVCDLCIAEYNDFIQHEFGVNIAHSTSQKCIQQPKTVEAANSLQTPPKETSIDKTGMTFIKDSKNSPNRSEQLVGSIPANWSWSSF